ncbi:MAG: hypothetical protein ACN4GW_01520 [Desulforhopalus sp.]
MKKKIVLTQFLAFVILVCLATQSVFAEDNKTPSNWKFDLAPFYLWAVTVDGDVTIGPKGGNVTLDFGDIFDNLQSAFIVHFETLYKDKYGLLFDINFISIGQNETLPEFSVDLDLEATVAELAPFYRWNNGDHTFDVLAGILYSQVETDAKVSTLPTDISVSEDWVDPYLGVRWGWSFAENWATSIKGAIGGFGVSSDFIWEGAALLSWQPWKHVHILAGYRAVGIDYETGSGLSRFVYDVTLSGPVFGINFSW